jgi:DNA-binding response OmpR family regulator
MGDKVLVVDDEKEIRELLDKFLTELGHEVIVASNGEEAIEVAERETPQVILLDIKMPGVDGVETCKRLKTNEKTCFIPVIMVTGLENHKMEAIQSGADDFVRKPFDIEELSIRVKSMLRIRHLTNELDRTVAYLEELEQNLPKE